MDAASALTHPARRRAVMLWGRWVLASLVGGALGGLTIDAAGILGALAFGALLGAAQWLVLQRRAPRPGQ